MLILTRRLNETLVIGDNEVRITVFDIQGSQVRIGIEADRGIAINRKEVYERQVAERLEIGRLRKEA